MKAKKILFVLLALALVFAIASCGGGGSKPCETCVDENSDGICDVCEKEIPVEEVADVPLFVNGSPTFQVVLAENLSSDIKQAAVNSIKSMLKRDYDVDVDLFYEKSEDDADKFNTEVLIGEVSSRGDEYCFDGHTFGKDGYIIKIVGKKIVINAGSEESLILAMETFAEDVLAKNDITNLVMTKDDVVVEIQDDYRVTALKVNGNDMKGYTIAANLSMNRYEAAALTLQDFIYDETGYWLDIVDIKDATDKSIIMKHVDGVSNEESFKVSAKGSQLVIECAFDNLCERASMQFTTQKIMNAKGEVDFKGTVYTQDISVVYYDDFGAVGDGRTDDFLAIYNAHVFANESGQPVKASRNPSGKVYYIYDTRTSKDNNNSVVSIPIRTNTDWQGVKFIIDDRKLASFRPTGKNDPLVHEPDYDSFEFTKHFNMAEKKIFSILPEEEHEGFTFEDEAVLDKIVADGLRPGTEHIDLKIDGWDGSLMIIPYNSEHGVFRRLGNYQSFQSRGAAMHEIIIIDKDGNVSDETPIMFEYTNIDYITVYKLDPTSAITVGSATFETWESKVKNERYDLETGKNLFSTSYMSRGISVSRSYTVVKDVTHEVVFGYTLKERASGLESCNYSGFFQASNANHITFQDCHMHGRQQYDGHSSYDFGANRVNKIVLKNCIQTNFWVTVDPEEGVMHDLVDYEDGAYTSMSSVQVKDLEGNLKSVAMCWGIGGTNYCKNMEYIDSQLSRFDAHCGLYNGKVINSKVNYLALTGYGDMIIENTSWYQRGSSETMIALRADYGYLWNGNISIKDTKAYVFDIKTNVNSLKLVNHKFSNFYFGYPTAVPNISIDNLDIYSLKNQAPVAPGFAVNVFSIASTDTKMHLRGDCGKTSVFTYVDANKDGYIDEPLFDINMDGRIDDLDKVDIDGKNGPGETNLKYNDPQYLDKTDKELNKGIPHPSCKINLNPVKPPEYIKIINNDGVDGKGGYVYTVPNTAGQGISDGDWYNTEESYGGFFGDTKFIYDVNGEEFTLIGTDHKEHTVTFKFG